MTIHGPSNVLNPLLQKWIASLVRHALTAFGVWLTAQAVASPEDVNSFIEAAVPIVVGLGSVVGGLAWAGLEKFRSRQKLVVAQALPAGATEKRVEQVIALGDAPSVFLPKDEAPPKIGAEPFKGTGPKNAA